MKLLLILFLLAVVSIYAGFIITVLSEEDTDLQDEDDQEQTEYIERWNDEHR